MIPINIYSDCNDALGAALTNCTVIAKRKGRIKYDYPVCYKGIKYPDAEAAYKANKFNDDEMAKQGLIHELNNHVMKVVMVCKLMQFQDLLKAITERGGEDWLKQCSHIGFGNRFEGKGEESAFIKNLIYAYLFCIGDIDTINYHKLNF